MSRKPKGSSSPFYDTEFAHTPVPRGEPVAPMPDYQMLDLIGSSLSGTLHVCGTCAAIVADIDIHNSWHSA